jgi:hypothetical protein
MTYRLLLLLDACLSTALCRSSYQQQYEAALSAALQAQQATSMADVAALNRCVAAANLTIT